MPSPMVKCTSCVHRKPVYFAVHRGGAVEYTNELDGYACQNIKSPEHGAYVDADPDMGCEAGSVYEASDVGSKSG